MIVLNSQSFINTLRNVKYQNIIFDNSNAGLSLQPRK